MKQTKIDNLVKKVLNILHIKVNKQTERLLIQIFKFALVGGTAFIIDFALLYLFKEVLKMSILLSNTLSFCISVIYNYIASIKWVFEINTEKSAKKNFIIFIIFSIIGLIINDIIMFIMADQMKINYLIAKIIATIIVMVFNFLTRKKFLE